MFEKSNVELTKVHYFEDSNSNAKRVEIPTISREVYQNNYNSNIVIKRNIFGHTWVLKINENQVENKKERCSSKLIVYVWVFSCILVAVFFGIYLSFDGIRNVRGIDQTIASKNGTIKTTTEHPILTTTTTDETTNLVNICSNCTDQEICLKTIEFHLPICVKIADGRDPTGCGGLCELNVQRCKKLHKAVDVFQCVKNGMGLRCSANEFNCGSSCILKTKRCDGAIDCLNMVDERNCECNLDYYFHCGNGTSCVENLKMCNGIVDCWDGFDEFDCERDCDDDKYPCVNGECIQKHQYCDGTYHCSDKSDEPVGCQK